MQWLLAAQALPARRPWDLLDIGTWPPRPIPISSSSVSRISARARIPPTDSGEEAGIDRERSSSSTQSTQVSGVLATQSAWSWRMCFSLVSIRSPNLLRPSPRIARPTSDLRFDSTSRDDRVWFSAVAKYRRVLPNPRLSIGSYGQP